MIAQTILAQLGGTSFIAMTGAKNMVDCGDALQFDLPARFARDGITKVRVALDPSDTYTVTGYKWKASRLELATVAETSGVYVDSLRATFTAITGLDASL